MRGDDEEAKRTALIVRSKSTPQRGEVARALGHLLLGRAVHDHEGVVDPVPAEVSAARSLGLRHFVLVVGEREVNPA